MVTERIGLVLLAGAPGSGKTSLLARWLVDPEFVDAALVVNELGDVALDDQLARGGRGIARSVSGGCICCDARDAFVTALEQLAIQRMQRKVSRFSRLIVEAAGLADPAAVRELLETHPVLRANYRLEGVIVAVDASQGVRSLEAHRECLAQVLHADAIVLTKTDVADENDLVYLQERLGELNPHAHVIRSVEGNAQPQLVMAAVQGAPDRGTPPETTAIAPDPAVRTFTLRPARALDADVLRTRVESFVERHGAAVLRMKGLLAVEGCAGPAVVQAAAGELYPVRLLPRWPEGTSSALVVITRGLDEAAARTALEEPAGAG